MSEQVFLLAFGIAATTVILTVKMIASAIGGRMARADLNQLREQLDQHAAALEDAQNSASVQATQIAELQERVDFAERMLAQSRDRAALKPGDKHE